MAVIGREPAIENIQSDISSTLGLKLEEKSLQVRAGQLNSILKNSSKVLIILDDVCENLKLEDIGILFESEDRRCKIMFTSRDEDVLKAMQVEKAFQVQILSDDEAWDFFKERVGDKAEDVELQPVAKMLVKECKGVPLVLEILGLALKEKEKPFWEKALVELRSFGPSAYQPLELSYMLGFLEKGKREDLTLTGNGLIILVFLEKVKKFRYCHSSTRIHLLNSSNEGSFHFLETLDLENLTNLKEVCEGPLPVGSFFNLRNLRLYEMPALLNLWRNPDRNLSHFNLRSVDIRNCKVMPYLFTLSTAMSFVHLEELRILFCGMMKEVLLNDLNKSTVIVSFPTLKKVILNSLSSRVAFSTGTKSMKFPQLQFLSITNMPKLQRFIWGDGSVPVFFDQKVEFDGLMELSLHGVSDAIRQIWSLKAPLSQFSRLEKLRICACNKLNNLFSPSIARALVSLKVLDIKDSLMMAEVIVNVAERTEKILFPNLERIIFWRLRSLRSFCQWKQDLELPSLSHVNICICPEMWTFTLGSLSTPKLQHFEVDNELVEIKDLNRYFRSMKRENQASSSTAGN